jgi:NitT/TauT family transport system ATP-binding protein
MRMRVSIARALVARPRLLLMDEPFGALDEMTRQALQDELLEIWRREAGTTVLFVTHNVFEAAFLSTRVVVLSPRPGRVVADLAAPHTAPRDDAFRATPAFAGLVGEISAALRHGGTA